MAKLKILDGQGNLKDVAILRPSITAPQTAFVLATAPTDAITVGVEPGAELSLALAIPNFISGGTFAVAFEKTTDGTNWTACSVLPKTLIAGSGVVTTATDVGLWRYTVELDVIQVRIRLTAITTLTAIWGWIEGFEDGRKIHLPFRGLTSGTFGQATNTPVVPAINWDRLGTCTLDIQTLSGTSQTMVPQDTNDDAGVNWSGSILVNSTTTTANPPAVSTTSAARFRVTPTAQYFRVNLTFSALTACAFNGVTATVVSADIQLVQQAATVYGPANQGSTATGAPVFTGGIAKTAQPTARTDGQVVAPVYDKVGRAIVRFGHVRDLITDAAAVTITSTAETTIAAAVASTFNDLQHLDIAGVFTFSGTPTAAYLAIRDTTAGTARYFIPLPLNSTPFAYNFNWAGSEKKQATVNTNWTAQIIFVGGTSPAITSGEARVTARVVANV